MDVRSDGDLGPWAVWDLGLGPTEGWQDRLHGQYVDRYVLGNKLGQTSMGSTYVAQCPERGRPVALVMLSPLLADDDVLLGQFLAGVPAVSHGNVLAFLEAGTSSGGVHYQVWEYVEGEHAGQVLRRRGRMPVSLAMEIGLRIASALDAAHAAGVTHGRLEPRAILLGTAGQLKLRGLGQGALRRAVALAEEPDAPVVEDLDDMRALARMLPVLAGGRRYLARPAMRTVDRMLAPVDSGGFAAMGEAAAALRALRG